MIEETDFETFLYVSKNRFRIFVFDKKKSKNLYTEECIVYDLYNLKDPNDLSKFLDENIYRIEKLVGNFIKNIILIIKDDTNSQVNQVNIAIKKKNNEDSINQKSLENCLVEIKDIFKENYQEQIIMHMVILNYIIDEKKYSSFTSELGNDHLCLDVNFISISENLAYVFDKLLEKYQIKISQYMCGNYIENFFNESDDELSLKANKLKNGLNINEVILVPRNIENKGFFEKFFQLFS